MFNPDFCYVELHTHLDGSSKPGTIWDISQGKSMDMPFEDEDSLTDFLQINRRTSLRGFLKRFEVVVDTFKGDKVAIQKLCYDFVESAAASRVCYTEARFSPHLFVNELLSVEDVLDTVIEALGEAGSKHGVVVKLLLCAIRNHPQQSPTALELAVKYQNRGVVGIDLAGDERYSEEHGGTDPVLIQMFEDAFKHGIHRTVHAGENGSVKMIKEAVEQMHAERIGHGYQILDDDEYYRVMAAKDIHFEVCPTSSFLTGSVPEDPNHHPFHKFVEDKFNYSINCDDMMITGRNLSEEYDYCRNVFKMSDDEISRTNLNAAKASFLNDKEKLELVQHLQSYFKI